MDSRSLRFIWTQYVRPYARWVVMGIIVVQLTVGGLARGGDAASEDAVAPGELPLPRTASFQFDEVYPSATVQAHYRGTVSLSDEGLALYFRPSSEALLYRGARGAQQVEAIGLALLRGAWDQPEIVKQRLEPLQYPLVARGGDVVFWAADRELTLPGVTATDLRGDAQLAVMYVIRPVELDWRGQVAQATGEASTYFTRAPKDLFGALFLPKPWELR